MGLTKNLKRIGMAAHNEKKEIRDEIEWQASQERKRKEAEAVAEEIKLMQDVLSVYGDKFADWYDSPAIPENGYAKDRIELIHAWVARQELNAKPVKWQTNEIPPTYRAVWSDEPGIARFEKTTAPTGSKGGEQEAMKKPATEILSQH